MAIQITATTAWKIIGILGLGVSIVWGASNRVRDIDDNKAAVVSLGKKSKNMELGIRRNRHSIGHVIVMQKAVLRKLHIPIPPEPEEFDDEVNDAGH